MTEPLSLLTAATLGLFGSGHCVGMCGGIAAALGARSRGQLLAYNSGRLLSYTLLGLLAGTAGAVLANSPTLNLALRLLAALLLIAMGLYVSGWWPLLARLEHALQPLWQRVAPLANRWLREASIGPALGAGLLWGLLPCGLIYSTLLWAGTAAEPGESALLMLAFGVGTLPAMLVVGAMGRQLNRLLQAARLRRVMGALLMVFGLWTAATALLHAQHGHGADASHGSKHHHH